LSNIEFSCPAASAQHCMELPDCIRRSRRRLRGQLQRLVRTPPISITWQSLRTKSFLGACWFSYRPFPARLAERFECSETLYLAATCSCPLAPSRRCRVHLFPSILRC